MRNEITRRSFLKATSVAVGAAGLPLGVKAALGADTTQRLPGSLIPSFLAHTHDLRLPDWGCYNNIYNGLSHVADLKQGLCFELGVFPGFFRREVLVANVKWASGFHPWEAAPDLSYFSYRYELLWKDQLFCDVSFCAMDDRTRLIRAEFVNRTSTWQNTVLHYMGYLYYPRVRPYTDEVLRRAEVKLPEGALWFDAIDYEDLQFATARPTDSLVPGAKRRAEIREHGFVSGSGVGAGFGKAAGDQVGYRLALTRAFSNAALVLRYRTPGQTAGQVHLKLSGAGEREIVLPASVEFGLKSVTVGPLERGPCRLRFVVQEPGSLELDGFALVESQSSELPRFEEAPLNLVPQIQQGPVHNSLVLKYNDAPKSYGLAWKHDLSEVREFHHSELDRFFRRNVQNHVHKVQVGDRKGHFTNVFIRPISLPPGQTRVIYGLATAGDPPEVEAALRQYPLQEPSLEALYSRARARRHQFSISPKGEPSRFSQERMAATVLTNVVYPVYGKRTYFRHNSPGKWWDSLYTWDSGFIALGLAELDVDRAVDCLNAYTTEPGDPQAAFMHIGTPLPVQIFAFWELWNRTQSPELLAYFYPRMRQYHMFLAGRYGSSTTRRLKSNLLVTWDYFYNTGWDDYPPQQYMHEKGLVRSLAPVITTAHAIRTAKMLRTAAKALAIEEDVRLYDADIALWSEAIQKHCWDAESGYYSYVLHDANGQPQGILRHSSGQNFNLGMDGVSPLIAGIGTPDQFQAQLANLKSDRHLWTRIGLSTVDQSAAYYRRDGYWNGAVWMPHQWFIWRSLLDWAAGDFAFQLARTALELWRNEVDESYHCFEHFLIESGRGAGWHQFGALSAPVLCWFAAYHVPGRLTTGFNAWVRACQWTNYNHSLEARLTFSEGPSDKSHLVAVMHHDGRYQATWNDVPTPFRELLPGVLQIEIQHPPHDGVLRIRTT